MPGSGSSTRALAMWVAVVLAATGCQMLSPARPSARAVLRVAPLGVPTGQVRVDLGKLRAAWGPRSLKSDPGVPSTFGDPVTLRLTVRGPGMSEVSASVPFVEPAAESEPVATLTLAVSAGQNRVFELEGLNADGKPVRRLMAAAAVAAGEPIDLEMSFLTDAVARVLDHLLGDPALTAAEASAWAALDGESLEEAQRTGTAPDQAGIVASLATTDLVAALTAHIDGIVGYDEAANSFTTLDPGRFRARLLANLLRLDGAAVLTAAADPRLATAPTGVVGVTVVDAVGTPVPGAAAAIYDLYRPVGSAKGVGQFDFFDVASGTWTVIVAYGGKVTYGTVDVVDDATTGLATVSLADTLPAPSPTPPLADLVVYEETPAWSFLDTVGGQFHDGNTVVEVEDHGVSHSGFSAIKFQVTSPDAVDADATAAKTFVAFQNGAFAGNAYEALEAWVRSDIAGTEVVGSFLDSAGNAFGTPFAATVGTTYQRVLFDLATMTGGMPGSVRGFVIRYRGTATPVLHVDDLRFRYPGSTGYVVPPPPVVYQESTPETGWVATETTATGTLDPAATDYFQAGSTALAISAGPSMAKLRFMGDGSHNLVETAGFGASFFTVSETSSIDARFLDSTGTPVGSDVTIGLGGGWLARGLTFAGAGLSRAQIESVRGVEIDVPPYSDLRLDQIQWQSK